MTHNDFLSKAFEEAFAGMRANKGGPFGAVVVRNGIVIGTGFNSVTSANDPTAHAEVNAIRQACSVANYFHLEDAVLYATCEPCPMCLAAIYWARIKKVYYCSSTKEAGDIGFDDQRIYKELSFHPINESLKLEQIPSPLGPRLFKEWADKKDKQPY